MWSDAVSFQNLGVALGESDRTPCLSWERDTICLTDRNSQYQVRFNLGNLLQKMLEGYQNRHIDIKYIPRTTLDVHLSSMCATIANREERLEWTEQLSSKCGSFILFAFNSY